MMIEMGGSSVLGRLAAVFVLALVAACASLPEPPPPVLIDQDPEISEQITLWSQSASRVVRGNLLGIPIRDSLMYVEPLYLQAESSQLPQLKRVLFGKQRIVFPVPYPCYRRTQGP